MWTISNWQARQKTYNRLGAFSWKKLIWENQHHLLTMYTWVALKENVKSVMALLLTTEMCSNPGFCAGTKEKLPTRASGKLDAETISSWSYDMEGHAKKCVERYCELANKTTQQLYKVATPCMDDHQFKEEENGVSRGIVYSLLTNCSEMSVFGSYWKTWYFVVCEQACACFNKMDQILWQTLGAFDIVHLSHKWIQAILLSGRHSTTM